MTYEEPCSKCNFELSIGCNTFDINFWCEIFYSIMSVAAVNNLLGHLRNPKTHTFMNKLWRHLCNILSRGVNRSVDQGSYYYKRHRSGCLFHASSKMKYAILQGKRWFSYCILTTFQELIERHKSDVTDRLYHKNEKNVCSRSYTF